MKVIGPRLMAGKQTNRGSKQSTTSENHIFKIKEEVYKTATITKKHSLTMRNTCTVFVV